MGTPCFVVLLQYRKHGKKQGKSGLQEMDTEKIAWTKLELTLHKYFFTFCAAVLAPAPCAWTEVLRRCLRDCTTVRQVLRSCCVRPFIQHGMHAEAHKH